MSWKRSRSLSPISLNQTNEYFIIIIIYDCFGHLRVAIIWLPLFLKLFRFPPELPHSLACSIPFFFREHPPCSPWFLLGHIRHRRSFFLNVSRNFFSYSAFFQIPINFFSHGMCVSLFPRHKYLVFAAFWSHSSEVPGESHSHFLRICEMFVHILYNPRYCLKRDSLL